MCHPAHPDRGHHARRADALGARHPPKSLLPEFGIKTRELQSKAMKGHDIRGWLPEDWVDSLSWAPISATYTQLTDAPEGRQRGADRGDEAPRVSPVDDDERERPGK